MVWVNQTQQRAVNDLKFAEDKEQLQLETSDDGILQCHGRIQGEYPIFLPDSSLFTTKFVQRAYLSTLHGGVGMVMDFQIEEASQYIYKEFETVYCQTRKTYYDLFGQWFDIYSSF
jgi:hypothetical protein